VSVERDGSAVVVRIPMRIKRVAGRMEVIVPEGLEDSQPLKAAPQEPLVTALARAFHWQQLIDDGKYTSITELAAALGVDRCYVRRILTLTTLAPDLVQAIVEGRESSGLSLERLVKGFPFAWDAQRNALAFPSTSGPPVREEATR
jgi:hypothetical protein